MDQQWLNTYREEIGGFSNTIHSFAQGEIARKDYKGISGGFGSYAQRDAAKHMLRLRLPGGRVTPERLHFMTQAVQQYHVPFLKLTTCEAIQMHDLTPDEVPAIMEAAIPCGIITRGGGGDNPRNIQASPLTGVQPGEAFDVMPWAEAATEYLLSICRDIHMPRKLKVAFCNGVDDCVHTAFRDMGFVAQPDGTFKLYIAGGLGGGWRMGILAAESLPAEDVLYYIRGMITTFCQHGNYQNRAKARTRFMQETLGPDELRRVFLENVAAAKADESLKLRLTPAAITKTGTGTLDDPRAIAQKQPGLYAVAYHPIGGRLIPEKLVQLDNLLSTIPGCECRVAPNETLYIINLTADEAAAVLDATADGAKRCLRPALPASALPSASRACGTASPFCSALCRPCGRLTFRTVPCPKSAFPAARPAAPATRPQPSASRARLKRCRAASLPRRLPSSWAGPMLWAMPTLAIPSAPYMKSSSPPCWWSWARLLQPQARTGRPGAQLTLMR